MINYTEEILLYLQKNFVKVLGMTTNFSLIKSIKTKQKIALKATWVSKILKYIDNSLIAKEAQAIILKGKYLIKKDNPSFNTKIWMRKAADIKKRLTKKQPKT